MNIFGRIKNKLRKDAANRKWRDMDFILNSNELNEENKIKLDDVQEAEHQIGRYLNMKAIAAEIKQRNLQGDVLEFGTWQGLGLIILHRLLNDPSAKFIGVDSFEGLPADSHFWRKGMFNNTSIDFARENIKKYTQSNGEQFHLIKGWFSDPAVKDNLYQLTQDIILVHFDADLGMSTTQALAVVQPFLVGRKKPVYFLFDDWGCHPDEVPDAFFTWVAENRSNLNFNLIKLSSTRFTRYYRLDFPAT